MWSRKTGSFSDDQNPEKFKPLSVDLKKEKTAKFHGKDAQYGTEEAYVGLFLVDILKLYHPQDHDDLAILHFENGMLVPVGLEVSTLKRLNAFIALQICAKTNCDKDFPAINKDKVYSVREDPRPIKFSWNKIVVPTLWHPALTENRSGSFSPWNHTDSLTGIEFVNSRAYYQQFDVGEPAGLEVLQARCQFCHGAHYVGASFGWDFVVPLPIYNQKTPAQLLNHVKYPKAFAKPMGLMMPNQKDVTLEEMQSIWRWMQHAAKIKKMPDYRP